MHWGFVLRPVPLSLQRLHRSWKQDIHHRAGVRPWQRCSLHLPSGRTQTDPGRLRPRLQHVLCCPWKPHQKPFSVFPHKGKLKIKSFVYCKAPLQVFGAILLSLWAFPVVFFCRMFQRGNIQLIQDKWAFDQRSANWQVDRFVYAPRACCLGLDTFYLHLEPKVKGPCRFGHWFTWSRCSIHLPCFPSIKDSNWVRKWKLPTFSG